MRAASQGNRGVERAQQVASTVQSVAATMAILAAAVAVNPLLQRERATAELERAQAELEALRIERRRSVLDVAVEVAALGDSGRDRFFTVTVRLSNKGNQPVRVARDNLRAQLVPVRIDDGQPDETDAAPLEVVEAETDTTILKALMIGVGECQTLTALARIRTVGPHLVRVIASPDGGDGFEFVGRTFVWVQPTRLKNDNSRRIR